MSETATPKPGPNSSESRRAVLRVLEEVDEPPCLSAGDVAKHVDFSRRTVNSRLNDLEEDGVIESGEVGGSPAYWTEHETDGGALVAWPSWVGGYTSAGRIVTRLFGVLAILFGLVGYWYHGLYSGAIVLAILYLLLKNHVEKYEGAGDPASEPMDLLRPFKDAESSVENSESEPRGPEN